MDKQPQQSVLACVALCLWMPLVDPEWTLRPHSALTAEMLQPACTVQIGLAWHHTASWPLMRDVLGLASSSHSRDPSLCVISLPKEGAVASCASSSSLLRTLCAGHCGHALATLRIRGVVAPQLLQPDR
jgi:hypothetical protein